MKKQQALPAAFSWGYRNRQCHLEENESIFPKASPFYWTGNVV